MPTRRSLVRVRSISASSFARSPLTARQPIRSLSSRRDRSPYDSVSYLLGPERRGASSLEAPDFRFEREESLSVAACLILFASNRRDGGCPTLLACLWRQGAICSR